MKQILILISKIILSASCLLLLISCVSDTEIDEVFEENTQDRFLNSLDKLNKLLLSPEFGWETAYKPGDQTGVYKMHLKFNPDNSVNITSEYENGNNDIATNYRVGISQSPELVFENYSTFGNLTDSFDSFLGTVNLDREAEFQFVFTAVANENEIILKSKSDIEVINDEGKIISSKTLLTLKKASANSLNNINNLKDLDKRITDDFNPNPALELKPFRGLRIENSNSQVILNSTFSYNNFNRSLRLEYDNENGEQVNDIIGVGITIEGISLLEPFTFMDTNFQNFAYNEITNEFISEVNGLKAIITRDDIPFYINKDADQIRTSGFTKLYYRPSFGSNEATSNDFIAITDRITDEFLDQGFAFFDFSIEFSQANSALLTIRIDDFDGFLFEFEYTFRQSIVDRKVSLEFIAPVDDGISGDVQSINQELIDFVETMDGLIYNNTGPFRAELPDGSIKELPNQSASLLSSENTDLSVYVFWL